MVNKIGNAILILLLGLFMSTEMHFEITLGTEVLRVFGIDPKIESP